MPKSTKRLIVEGQDDRFSVVGLMRAHLQWPQDKNDAPVWIELGGSAEEILEPEYLSTQIKSSEITVLGVMFDADSNPRGRYQRCRTECKKFFPDVPEDLPVSGVVCENGEKRLGIWIMPDNAAEGCLETFLRCLVPNALEPLWAHALDSVTKAKELGAQCRDPHRPKADLYTWLAWQDPPSQNPGMALTKKILDPHGPSADPFVKWFRQLYRL